MALVMKLHFPDRKERSEIRSVLTVVAVLMIGMVAKLDATMQLFHLSRKCPASRVNHTPDVES
jgi:hypothetical protein